MDDFKVMAGLFGAILSICAISATVALWRLARARESIAQSMQGIEDHMRRMAGVPPTLVK